MNKKILLFYVFFQLIAFTLSAQNLKKTWKLFRQKQYAEAKPQLEAILLKNDTNAFVHYALSRIYQDTTFFNFSLFEAAAHMNKASSFYDKTNKKDKKLLGNEISFDQIESEKATLKDELFYTVKFTEDILETQQFLVLYPKGNSSNFIKKVQNKLLFNSVKESGKIENYRAFIQNVPNAEEVYEAKEAVRQFVFDSVSQINTVDAYTWFMKNYQNTEQYKDAKLKRFLLSQKSLNQTNILEALNKIIHESDDADLVKMAKLKRTSMDSIYPEISTFLGNEKRNYYGNKAPSRLNVKWKLELGGGSSPAYGQDKYWAGAGWTGQPILVREGKKNYIIQPSFDYNLKKIDAETGKVIWQYKYDDILKASPTFWVNNNAETKEDRYVIMQGSRRGVKTSLESPHCWSFRAVSYITGKELWRLDVRRTPSYSRDVDGSCIVVNDTGYLALENALFTVFDPDYKKGAVRDSFLQPAIYKEVKYYTNKDLIVHVDNIESESSPCVIGNCVYTAAGSGHVFGFDIRKKQNVWDYPVGSDLNGSMPATFDNCLLLPIEKQYIAGRGGVLKLNPKKAPSEAVEWFFPTENAKFSHWDGGIIGSVSVNDSYVAPFETHLAAFTGVDGFLYVIQTDSLEKGKKESGPDSLTLYPKPRLVFKDRIAGSISTPLILKNRLIAASDIGIYLYEYKEDKAGIHFRRLDSMEGMCFDASPIVWNGKVYVAARNGYFYCLGD